MIATPGGDEVNGDIRTHAATRRGFIAAAGCGVVVPACGLWAAYGLAPLGSQFGGDTQPSDHERPPRRARGHGAPNGPAPEAFRAEVERFIAANQQADGSVWPGRGPPAQAPADHAHHTHATAPGPQDDFTDVYLMPYRWGYAPAVLRLDRDRVYRFRMMAVDVTHGASIHLGPASHMIRLRAHALVEQRLRFTAAGEYLVYCTAYCGLAHDQMHGKIIVA
ncbi:MAG: hypothetical protein U1F68_11785 [Gammaproteobacteria bacterium]